MRIVLDTNVLIAAFISRGVCTDLLEHCIREHALLTSEFILGEFREHLLGKFKYSESEVRQAEELLRLQMQVVEPSPLEEPVCRDPDDDMVLGTGLAGNVACIITGDKDLLALKRYKSIDILKPAEFAAYEATE